MRLSRLVLPAVFLILAFLSSFGATAQDMDTIEGVYHRQYDKYMIQERALRQQMQNLANLKSQVDNLIAQVAARRQRTMRRRRIGTDNSSSSSPRRYSTARNSTGETSNSRKSSTR